MLGNSSSVDSPKPKVVHCLLLATLALATTAAVWGPLLDAPFLIDDLTWSAAVYGEDGGFSWAKVGKLMWPSDPAYDFQHHFRPLGHLSFALNDRALGYAPASFRVVNLCLLALSSWLVGVLALRLGASKWCAFLVTLGVVLHGCSFETIGWVAHRFTLQANVGFLLALMATLRMASNPRAGVKTLVLCGVVALFSKDSMLAALWAIPVAAFLFSLNEHRFRNFTRCSLVILALVILNVCLRKLSTGLWLPALMGDRDVVQDLSFVHIIDSLPEFIRRFAAPFTDASVAALPSGTVAITAVLGAASVVAALLIKPFPCQGNTFRLFVIALVVCGLMFSVLQVGNSLSGARRYHLLSCLWLLWIGVGSSRSWRGWVLAMYILLLGVSGWTNARVLNDGLMRYVSETTNIISDKLEALPDSRPMFVAGVAHSVQGLPAFGANLEHLPMRFRPPMARVEHKVFGSPSSGLLQALSVAEAGQSEVLIFQSGTEGMGPQFQFTWTPLSIEGTSALSFESPSDERTRWPGQGGPVLKLQLPESLRNAPGTQSPSLAVRVSLRHPQGLATWLFAASSVNWENAMLTIDLVQDRPLVPPFGVNEVMKPLMARKSASGSIRVDLLGAHKVAPTWSTPWQTISLGL